MKGIPKAALGQAKQGWVQQGANINQDWSDQVGKWVRSLEQRQKNCK